MGIDKNLGKELNNTLDQLKKLRDFASRKPITAKATLNKTQWDKKYAELMYDAEKLRAKLDREHESTSVSRCGRTTPTSLRNV